MSDWQGILKTVAPWLGAAATGGVPALVGMAAAQLSGALGKELRPTVDAIGQAISGATPDQMLAIKQADQQFAERMRELGFQNEQELERIAASDRADARARQIAMKDYTPQALALVTLCIWGLMQYTLLQGDVPSANVELISRALGTLDALLGMSFTYFLGSTIGSRRKTELMAST